MYSLSCWANSMSAMSKLPFKDKLTIIITKASILNDVVSSKFKMLMSLTQQIMSSYN